MKGIVSYVRRDGQVLELKNPDSVQLRYGTTVYQAVRQVVTETVFEDLRRQNPDVAFNEEISK